MAENLTNIYSSTLAAEITAGATALEVVSAVGAPAANFRIRVDDEFMLVTSVGAGTDWTVTRGIEGSAAAAHAVGATLTHVLTAGGLTQFVLEHAGTGAGGPVDWDLIVNTPTTAAGYGITDVYTKTQSDALYAPVSHAHAWGDITGAPTTLGGYGITDAYTRGDVDTIVAGYQPLDADLTAVAALSGTGYLKRTGIAAWALAAAVAWADVSGTPTTLGGYGITDAYTKSASDARFAALVHTHAWSDVTGTPTTLSGYGVTDAQPLDADLTAIAALSTTGYLQRTGANTWATTATVAWGDLSGVPTTLAGYGITDAYTKVASDARFAAIVHTHAWADVTGTPTTLSGYGITDAYTKVASDARFAAIVHTHAWADVTGTPTTLSGYGITDAQPLDADLTAIAALATTGYAKRTGANTWALSTTVPWADITGTPTTLSGYGITDAQPLDADLTAIAALSTTGYLKRTGVNTWATTATVAWADLTGTPTTLSGYGITDAYTKVASDARFAAIVHTHAWADVTGTPTTLSGYGITDAQPLDADLTAIAALSTTGYAKRTAANTWALSATLPWGDLTGTPTTLSGYGITDAQPLDADLTAIAAFSSTGIAVRTAANTWAQRSIAGTASRISVTNATGAAGDPTLDIDAAYVGQATITTLGTVTTGVWNAGAITSSGVVQGTRFTSTVTTGTAPFTVTSTTKVTNLYADRAALADTVTTNANLTGHVTSVGNATVLGSFTLAQLNTAVSDADLARTDAANTFTGVQTFSSTIVGSVNGNAATVTTNANLTGHVTSVGNAAVLGSFTLAQLSTAVSDADIARIDAGQTFTGVQTFSSTIAGSINGNAATVTTNANLTGPVTSVGNATTVTANAITLGMMAQIATGTLLGRTTALTGNVEVLTAAQGRTVLGLGAYALLAALTGPITADATGATAIASQTGTGTKFVVDNGPTLIAPVLGAATATSINKVAITAPATSATLTIANLKTLTANASLTLTGTDATTMTFPTTTATVARTDAAQTFTGVQTFSSTIVGSINGNAATVTTNANLTGPITSSGNATAIASQTGTGTQFVMSAGPTITGTLTAATIAASGNISTTAQFVGVGNATFDAVNAALATLYLGRDTNLVAEKVAFGGNSFNLTQNAYFDGASSWRYIETSFASNYYQYQGTHNWRVAASGTAGAVVSWTTALTLDNSGNLGIGMTPARKLDVTGTFGATGAATLGSTLALAGDFAIATNKFTVAASTGNTVIAGTLNSGATSLSSLAMTGALTGATAINQVASVSLAAQAANVAKTNAYTTAATGWYLVSWTITDTRAATSSATLPTALIWWTEPLSASSVENNTAGCRPDESLLVSNAVGATRTGTIVVYAKTGTNISYSTTGYVSSGATTMQYGFELRVQRIG